MVLSVLGPTAAFAGSAGAADHQAVSIDDDSFADVVRIGGATDEGYVVGTATDAGGDPIDHANVHVFNRTTDVSVWGGANETGDFNVSVPEGTYTVEIHAEGYVTETHENIDVAAGETSDGGVIVLEEVGYVAGTVFDSDGNPLDSGEVVVTDHQGVWRSAAIEADGTYNVSVPEGTYYVEADAEAYVRNATEDVAVTAGNTTTLDVSLEDAGFIAGTVHDPDGEPVDSAHVIVHNDDHSTHEDIFLDERDGGRYNASVPGGSYTVLVDSDEYGSVSHSDVAVTVGETTKRNVTLEPAGYVVGTVTDEAGDPIENARVVVHNPVEGVWQSGYTDGQGSFNLSAPAGEYDVEVDADGFAPTVEEGVAVTVGERTELPITLAEASRVEGTVTDADGTPIEGAEVFVHDDGYQVTEFATTDAAGEYAIEVPAGTYTVRVDADGYGPVEVGGIETAAGEVTTHDVELHEPAVITGTVSDAGGSPVERAVVVATDGSRYYFDEIDSTDDGNYSIELPTGTYSLEAYTKGAMAVGDEPIAVENGDRVTTDLELVNPTIHDVSVEHVGDGPQPDMDKISVGTAVAGGFMQVQLIEAGGSVGEPHDLEPYNVTASTDFEISLTVEDFEPNSLLWGAKDVAWETAENTTMEGNVTDVTVRTKPVTLQGLDPAEHSVPIGPVDEYEHIEWPDGENDQADFGWNRTVYFGLFDLSNVPGEIAEYLDGMTITTNAQTFSRPVVTEDSLEIYVGAPHLTTEGDRHDGFYRAFVPDDLLAEWDVDDPATDLNAMWKGESSDFTVTETADGAWIEIAITYSAGTLSVTTDDGGSGGGGFVPPPPSDEPEDGTEETTDDSAEAGDDSEDGTDEDGTDEDGTDEDEPIGDEPAERESESSDGMPGFGPIAALLALLAAAIRLHRPT